MTRSGLVTLVSNQSPLPALFVPGGVNPAAITYGDLLAALKDTVDPVLKDHELYAADAPPPKWGLSTEVEALRDWRKSGLFGPEESALLAYVDAMTRDVAGPEAGFKELREHFSERAVVELTVLIAAYNMHTRVLKALDIQPERA